MCMFPEYCLICDCLEACDQPQAQEARKEKEKIEGEKNLNLTPAEKHFLLDVLAGAPDAGVMGIVL